MKNRCCLRGEGTAFLLRARASDVRFRAPRQMFTARESLTKPSNRNDSTSHSFPVTLSQQQHVRILVGGTRSPNSHPTASRSRWRPEHPPSSRPTSFSRNLPQQRTHLRLLLRPPSARDRTKTSSHLLSIAASRAPPLWSSWDATSRPSSSLRPGCCGSGTRSRSMGREHSYYSPAV